MRSLVIFILVCVMLVGCQKYPNKVQPPPLSETVAEGKATLHYKADSAGVVYLQRAKRHQMIWRGEVSRGDEIVVDLKKNALLVNGRKVNDVEIELATYRLLVERT